MIAAIMQPYFFPYIGYFQLMRAVDVFVLYDDVQYMKGGWINRNRIRLHNEAKWFTFPTKRASVSLFINEREYVLGNEVGNAKNRLTAAYRDTPAFSEIGPFLFELLDFSQSNVAVFNANVLTQIARRLGIQCKITCSSALGSRTNLAGEERVIDLCHRVRADQYVNAIGGIPLYDPGRFAAEGIKLSFLSTTVSPSELSDGSTYLSIIDDLMHKGFEGTSSDLDRFQLVDSPKVRSV